MERTAGFYCEGLGLKIKYYKYKMLNDNFATQEKLNKNKLTKEDVTNIITFANSNYQINNIYII